jgi:hypothetical protein
MNAFPKPSKENKKATERCVVRVHTYRRKRRNEDVAKRLKKAEKKVKINFAKGGRNSGIVQRK